MLDHERRGSLGTQQQRAVLFAQCLRIFGPCNFLVYLTQQDGDRAAFHFRNGLQRRAMLLENFQRLDAANDGSGFLRCHFTDIKALSQLAPIAATARRAVFVRRAAAIVETMARLRKDHFAACTDQAKSASGKVGRVVTVFEFDLRVNGSIAAQAATDTDILVLNVGDDAISRYEAPPSDPRYQAQLTAE